MFTSSLVRSASAALYLPLASRRALISSTVISRRAISSTSKCGQLEPESAYESAPSSIHKQQHSYLQDLLDADDANAPWHQSPVEMVSREVQSLSSVHKSWE
ncbi:hypothetical protein H4S06_001419 [Coemansia sp. BCRC 34490]|nr:hypothetical protein H4S06_001419 [Coemansia sp. BCRC 34490]